MSEEDEEELKEENEAEPSSQNTSQGGTKKKRKKKKKKPKQDVKNGEVEKNENVRFCLHVTAAFEQEGNSNIDCIPLASKPRMCSFPRTLPG